MLTSCHLLFIIMTRCQHYYTMLVYGGKQHEKSAEFDQVYAADCRHVRRFHGKKRSKECRTMKNIWKKSLLLCLGGVLMAGSIVSAHPIRTPEGNMPMVHWAVLESTPGNMQAMGPIPNPQIINKNKILI